LQNIEIVTPFFEKKLKLLKKKILHITIVFIFSVLYCHLLYAKNYQDTIQNEVLSAFYQNNYNEVIDVGVSYLTNKKGSLSDSGDLIILAHVFKAYVQISDLQNAFNLLSDLKKQNQSDEFRRYVNFYEACIYLASNRRNDALLIFNKLLNLSEEKPLPDSIQAKIYHNLAICYNSNRKKKLELISKSFELSKKLLYENNDYQGYNMSSSMYIKTLSSGYKRYEEAYDLFKELFSLSFNKEVTRENEYLYSTYLLFCIDIGLSNEFDITALKLEEFYLSNLNSYNLDLSILYNRQGAYLKNSGRYTEALNYYQKALSICEPIVNYRNSRPESCKQLARIYRDLDNEKLSLKYARQAIFEAKIKKTNALYLNYASIAYLFADLDSMAIAKAYLDSAIVDAKQHNQLKSNKTLNNQVAWTYLALKDYIRSIQYFNQLESILNTDDNFAPYEYWDNTNDMALAYLGLNDYTKVIDILIPVYQQVILQYSYDIQQNNASRISRLFKRVNLNLAKAYFGLFKQTNINDNLQKSLEHLEQADQSIDAVRSQLNFDTDRVAMGDLYAEYIELAVKINIDLYNVTHQEYYLKNAYEFAQKGKSYSLLLGLNDKQIKVRAGIPDSLIQRENYLKGRLSFYQNEVDHLKLSAKPNEDDLSYLMSNRDKYLQELDSLNSIIKREYPNYYQLKYVPPLASIEDIQMRLGKNQVLIDYLLSEDRLIQFVLTHDSYRVNEVPVANLFYDDLNLVLKEISSPFLGEGNSVKRIKAFAKASNYLYTNLLGTLKEDIKGKDLVIIPHAELAYLSFESLLTKDVSSQKPDFRHYPWLINDFNISYEYNAAILPYFNDKKRMFNKVYSFAPEYYGDESMKDSILVNIRQAINNYLMPLASAKDEIENISEIFNSEIYVGDEASKINFLQNANANNIMHLAMHSLNDELLPLNSQLVFSSVNDSNEVLKAFELYNYNLKSPMVVLSSCSTGRGRRKSGEGLISLARAFKYSGVETQVFTLWRVHDQSGAKLTELFYRQLKNKKFKDEALRQAKLEFIESSSAIQAHPYYWANYVVTGSTSPIEQQNHSYYWYLLLILPISLIVIIKRSKNNQ